jgi:hypothetical protein
MKKLLMRDPFRQVVVSLVNGFLADDGAATRIAAGFLAVVSQDDQEIVINGRLWINRIYRVACPTTTHHRVTIAILKDVSL